MKWCRPRARRRPLVRFRSVVAAHYLATRLRSVARALQVRGAQFASDVAAQRAGERGLRATECPLGDAEAVGPESSGPLAGSRDLSESCRLQSQLANRG